jgi:hypothetical protein
MRPGLSFRVFERRWRRPVGRCTSSEPRFTECGAGLSSQRVRPMTGFAEQSNLALVFCNAGLQHRNWLTGVTDDAALPIAKLVAVLVDGALLFSSILCVEPYRAAFFLRNIFRFCVATAGSAATAPPRDCRPKAGFCLMPFSLAASSPHACRKTARLPASRLSA